MASVSASLAWQESLVRQESPAAASWLGVQIISSVLSESVDPGYS